MRSNLHFVFGTVLLLMSCGGGKNPEFVPAPPPPRPAPPPPKPAQPLRRPVLKRAPPPKPAPPADVMDAVSTEDRIYYDDAAAFTDSTRLTISDAQSWEEVWRKATQAQATTPALPEVDFNQYMLLLVAAGRLKPGDEIHVDSIGLNTGRPIAVVRTVVQCSPFPGNAYPLEIVRLPRSDSTIAFIERRPQSEDCEE